MLSIEVQMSRQNRNRDSVNKIDQQGTRLASTQVCDEQIWAIWLGNAGGLAIGTTIGFFACLYYRVSALFCPGTLAVQYDATWYVCVWSIHSSGYLAT